MGERLSGLFELVVGEHYDCLYAAAVTSKSYRRAPDYHADRDFDLEKMLG